MWPRRSFGIRRRCWSKWRRKSADFDESSFSLARASQEREQFGVIVSLGDGERGLAGFVGGVGGCAVGEEKLDDFERGRIGGEYEGGVADAVCGVGIGASGEE